MQELWMLQFNIFIMIAVGFLVKRIGLINHDGEKSITNLVMNVVLPCNIFCSFLTDLGDDMAGDMLIILAVSMGIQILAVVWGKLFYRHETPERQMNLAYAMICSNAGFLGNPIAEGVFGSAGLMLASIYLIPQRIMMWSEGIAIYSGIKDHKAAVRNVLTHPCVIACALGILVMVTGFKMPKLLTSPLETIAKCNTALSMLLIGMILADINLKSLVDKSVVIFTVHRLVVLPAIVYGVCLLLGLSHLVTGVSTLLAAMPAGATTSMMALKYDRDPAFATRLVIFSTLCSIPAVLLWSMILA